VPESAVAINRCAQPRAHSRGDNALQQSTFTIYEGLLSKLGHSHRLTNRRAKIQGQVLVEV
jgi:hypothetical protein